MKLSKILTFALFSLLIAAGFMVIADAAHVTISHSAAIVAGGAVNLLSYVIPSTPGVLGIYVGSGTDSNGEAMVQSLVTDVERAAYLHHSTSQRFRNKKLVPGYLRLEALIKNTEGKVTFKTFIGDGTTVKPTENRLDRNDAFIATSGRIGLLKQDTANGKTNGQVVYYPNITIFGAAAAADLWAIYQGALRMNIDNVDELKAFPMARFLNIPQTQQTGATNYDNRNSESGLVHFTPHIIIDGDKKNEIEVNFPTFAGFAGATPAVAGNEHFLVLELYGLQVLGGSKGA